MGGETVGKGGLLRHLLIGVCLGIGSAAAGAAGAAGFSGTGGGIAVLMLLGAPYVIGTMSTDSHVVGVLISVGAWCLLTIGFHSGRRLWARSP